MQVRTLHFVRTGYFPRRWQWSAELLGGAPTSLKRGRQLRTVCLASFRYVKFILNLFIQINKLFVLTLNPNQIPMSFQQSQEECEGDKLFFFCYKLKNITVAYIFAMFNPFERAYITDENLYFRTNRYELWAHLSSDSVLIQLKSFLAQGAVKTFAKSFTAISHQNIIIDHGAIFQELSKNQPKQADGKRGKILLELKTYRGSRSNLNIQIELDELKNEPTFENWLMLKVIKEKSDYLLERIKETNNILSDSIQLEGQTNPHFKHENEKYRFEAELDSLNREIRTQLIVKSQLREGRPRDKCYKSAIREKDWDYDYRNQFKNIETLFEHLKNTNNYQVLESKGLIKIRNQPIPILDLTSIKNFPGVQTEKTLTKNHAFTQQRKKIRKDSENLESQRKLLIEKQLIISKQISQLGHKLQTKLHGFIKDSQKQISNYENQEYKKYQGKFKNLEKQIRNELNSNLKKQIQDIKKEAQKIIKQIVASYEIKMAESSANMRKSHLIEPRSMSQETKAERVKNVQNFYDKEPQGPLTSESGKQRIEVDKSSSQIQYFYVGQDGDLIYRGPWEWTQVFTTSKIDFNGVYEFKFRVLKSMYNAIAIGVSSLQNKHEKSSLTKSESISWWGDGEIWQKNKVKEQGEGFRIGQIITMQVNRGSGEIKWISGKNTVAHNSKILSDRKIPLFAYLQMYDQGDKIELLTCKIL